MTEQQTARFKENIYTPFNTAWQIVHAMRTADTWEDKDWEAWLKTCDEFSKQNPSEIGQSLYRVLLDVGDEVGRIVRQK